MVQRLNKLKRHEDCALLACYVKNKISKYLKENTMI